MRFEFQARRSGPGKPLRIEGSFKGTPPLWYGAAIVSVGAFFALTGIGTAVRGAGGDLFSGITFTLCGAGFIAAGVGFIRVRNGIRRCLSLDEINPNHSAEGDPAPLQGLEPRYVVNGQPFFAPEDVTPAASLLRPASHSEHGQLLRPAGGNPGKEQNLLRRADQAETCMTVRAADTEVRQKAGGE